MDCAKVKETLHPYIDGALPASTRRELEKHLLNCPDCAAELARLQALTSALRSLPQPDLPPGFAEALHEKLALEPKPTQPALLQRGWVRAVAAAAMLLLVIGFIAAGGNTLRSGAVGRNAVQYAVDNAAPAAMPAPAPATAAPSLAEAPMAVMPEEAGVYDYGAANNYAVAAGGVSTPLPEGTYAPADESSPDDGSALATQLERKKIRDANLSLRVDNFPLAYQKLNDMAERYGGYVVSSNAYNYDGETMQSGYITLRVDANRLDEALAEIGTLGKVENNSINTQDITMEYYDIAGRLTQYQAQEKRLLEILAKAETVEDMVTIERELTRVRAELESLNGQLRYYDQMTALSSINVNLYQPDDTTQRVRLSGWAGLWQDIREAFISGINWLISGVSALVIGFFRLLPLLLLLVVVVTVIVLLLRKRRG